MNKRKLRRVAIVALVLVLLCNTLGVQAETGAPAVTVSSYEELVNAIDQASNLDTILIGAVIWIPEGASLGEGSKTVILMYSESRREHWISQKLSEYSWSEEYQTARDNLMEAVKALDKYDDLKKLWEKKNHDIIEAERQRSKREELLSADPEALRALGITPPPVQKVSRAEEDPEFNETLEALRAIHPSATDAEIEQMAKLM